MLENEPQGPVNQIVGTTGDDSIATGDNVDHVNGHAGSDTLTSGEGNDLVAGDMVGREWVFVDGQWVFIPDAISSNGDAEDKPDFHDASFGPSCPDRQFAHIVDAAIGRNTRFVTSGSG
ncbi:MAG: hypothetical protein JJ868_02500 [Shimia sp.]|uniref:hypothetical protein n=1 Tax=Shimia sp. TaxID=1954381 RepID=UPI001B2134B3|nr:hypothetical protein [Shimia sp.]MBO6896220.1 hypothetical protein [Shimia sp.]